MRFPTLTTRTLQGAQKDLPADLPAVRTLVLLAFHQRHQRDVDEWMAVAQSNGWLTDLTTVGPDLPACAAIEVPCISRRWGPARRFIDGGMATGIQVPTVLARTWTAYTDVGRVQGALGITSSDDIWVGVVAASGEVLTYTTGRPDPGAVTSVAGHMQC